MSFTQPWGLLALLAVPVIIGLHLFRNRLPEQRVSAVFLFPGTAVASDGGRTRTPLRRSRSLWFECLAAVLAALWLSGFTMGDLLPRHLVLVLDRSASMSARGAMERTSELLRQWGDELSVDDEVSVIVSGEPAQVVVGPRARRSDLAAFSATWRPTLPSHAIQGAIDLGRELAGHSGEIVLVTDREPSDPGQDLRIVGCGRAAGNAAIGSLQRVRGADSDRLLVTVVAYGEVPAGDVLVTAGDRELLRTAMSAMGEAGKLELSCKVPRDVDRVRVRLPDDELAIDNDAWWIATAEPIVSVCDQLPETVRGELELPRLLESMSGWREEADPRRAQLILASSAKPLSDGQIGMVLAPSDGRRRGHTSPFVIDRSHAMLSGVELQGVAWQAGGGNRPGQVLVASGDRVLLSVEETDGGTLVWVDLDGRAGNFVRSPDWPILFANVLDEARRQVPGCVSRTLAVGEELRFRSGQRKQRVTLHGPDGSALARSVGDLEHVCREPGPHAIRARDGETLAEVAVRFVDPAESDLRRARRFDLEAVEASRQAAAARVDAGPMRRMLAVLLLLVLAGNWWLLGRRAG